MSIGKTMLLQKALVSSIRCFHLPLTTQYSIVHELRISSFRSCLVLEASANCFDPSFLVLRITSPTPLLSPPVECDSLNTAQPPTAPRQRPPTTANSTTMAANGQAIREEELEKVGGCLGDFAACSTSMVALMDRIRQQTPQTGARTVTTPEERRLFLLGVKALNWAAQSALKAFGQATPLQLGVGRWYAPRLHETALSSGRTAARLSYIDITMDVVMALTQGDQTKLDPPSAIYRRTAGRDNITLDGDYTLLQAASELFQLSTAAEVNTYSYAQGFQVVLPALENAGHGWNAAIYPYVERTLTALAHSHSVWFSCLTKHFQVTLWGLPVPGTDVTKLISPTGPAHESACALYRSQPTKRALATSAKQELCGMILGVV